jgi:hypothetical protein
MQERSATIAAGAAFFLALLITGCGDRDDSASTNNSAVPVVESVNQFTIGNDASAVETVGNSTSPFGGEAAATANVSGPGGAPSGSASGGGGAANVANSSASGNGTGPAEVTGSGAPGGDRGGNTVQSNVSGM